ncbi:MAG: UvrB/UvrC motif-containing protein [Clostridia bacterium]|nr:UvrB/UvrC motif-containing protein [Clostridia bacterium]
MKCDNCGKNNANVKYLRNINGEKTEMNLCEECSKKLGINTDINFDIPIDFSSFLGGFFEDFDKVDFPYLLSSNEETKCKGCNSTFEDILNRGKFGCPTCYETFETQIDNLMNKIHGSNRHVGRLGIESAKESGLKEENKKEKVELNDDKVTQLKAKLKELVKQEKYEEAAKVRDEIKKLLKRLK